MGIVWVEAQRDWMRLLEEGVCKCSVACICLHLLFFLQFPAPELGQMS